MSITILPPVTITAGMDAAEAWAQMGSSEGILESFVTFEQEVSVIVARRECIETARRRRRAGA